MNDLSMDIQLRFGSEDENIMELSVHIVPSEVLERAQQGRNDLVHCQQLSDDLDKLFVKLIAREVSRRFATKLADGFKVLTGIRQVPSFITQLLEIGCINHSGELLQEACIDDLLTGKYREQFEQWMPQELLREGMEIRETIETFFAISQYDADSLIHDARERHALLEIIIRETVGGPARTLP